MAGRRIPRPRRDRSPAGLPRQAAAHPPQCGGALLRRLDPDGLPRVDRITDVYNAVSIAHLLPVGGEDRGSYAGPARLVRAEGSEAFDTTAGGEPVTEHPDVGEVV